MSQTFLETSYKMKQYFSEIEDSSTYFKDMICVIYKIYMKSYKAEQLNYIIKYLIYFIEKNNIIGDLVLMKTVTIEFSIL